MHCSSHAYFLTIVKKHCCLSNGEIFHSIELIQVKPESYIRILFQVQNASTSSIYEHFGTHRDD